MWFRSELKSSAKKSISNFYWLAVLFTLLFIITNVLSSIGNIFQIISKSIWTVNTIWDINLNIFYPFFLISNIRIVIFAIQFFVLMPYAVGVNRAFMIARKGDVEFKDSLFVFDGKFYINIVITIFLKALFTFLWTLLFIIPGIIKSYEYRMIPYILAENPALSYKEAFELSKKMMYGQKWKTFVLDLSFIGWYILSSLTCGLLNVFWIKPYKLATNIELYVCLKNNLISSDGNVNNKLTGFGSVNNTTNQMQ